MTYHETVDIGYGTLVHEEKLERGKGILEVWTNLGMFEHDSPVLTWRQNRKTGQAKFITDQETAGIPLVDSVQELAIGFPWEKYYVKNTGVRDSQRRAVYKWENDLFRDVVKEEQRWLNTMLSVEDYVRVLCDRLVVDPPMVKFTKSLTRTAGHYARNRLTLKQEPKYASS